MLIPCIIRLDDDNAIEILSRFWGLIVAQILKERLGPIESVRRHFLRIIDAFLEGFIPPDFFFRSNFEI